MQRSKNAFTLIELLVVIAIIAILAAILFPVFAQARESARKITCISNTKQISMAFMQYVQDYDEQFPFGQYYDGEGLHHNWAHDIHAYTKMGSSWLFNKTNVYMAKGDVFRCPSFPSDQSF